MSIESPIREEDRWFTGEDKTLRWVVQTPDNPLVPQDVTGWTMELTLRRRRDEDAAPIDVRPVSIVDAPAGLVQVLVPGSVTAGLEGGTYHYVMRRVDEGANAVLAYGPTVIRKVELA